MLDRNPPCRKGLDLECCADRSSILLALFTTVLIKQTMTARHLPKKVESTTDGFSKPQAGSLRYAQICFMFDCHF